MKLPQLSRLPAIAALLFTTLACDQATKMVARRVLANTPASEYLGGMLRIQFAENTGAFLSLGSAMDEHSRFLMFTAGVGVFLVGATYVLLRKSQMDRRTTAGLTLLVAGGLGNLIDRLIYGYVTDFLNVGIGQLRTGIFNVADMAIVLGVILLFFADSGKKSARERTAT